MQTNTWNERRKESGFDKHILSWCEWPVFKTWCSSIVYTAWIYFRMRVSESASKWTICISISIIEINCAGSYSIRRNVWLLGLVFAMHRTNWINDTLHIITRRNSPGSWNMWCSICSVCACNKGYKILGCALCLFALHCLLIPLFHAIPASRSYTGRKMKK